MKIDTNYIPSVRKCKRAVLFDTKVGLLITYHCCMAFKKTHCTYIALHSSVKHAILFKVLIMLSVVNITNARSVACMACINS